MIKRNKSITSIMSIILLISVLVLITACSKTNSSNKPSDTSNKPSDTSTQDAPKDAVFAGGWPYATVPTGHFNMFVANAISLKFYRELHQLPLATYRAGSEEYVPMLAEQWKLSEDNKEIQVNLRNDVTWFSGDKFTSKDVWTTFMAFRLVGDPVWNYIEEVEVINDSQLTFKIKEETTMIYRYILRKPIVDYKTYGSFADKVGQLMVDGKDETSEEWKALVSDFTNFRPEIVNATGPYYLDPAKVSQSHIELAKNDTSFLADVVNFEKVIVYNGDVPDLTPLVLNKKVDYLTHQFPPASMKSFDNTGYSTIQLQGVDGIAMYFNAAVKPLDQIEVRQAIAYVIDRDRIGELALPGVTRGTDYISGLGDLMTETWVDTTKLIDYAVNTGKATELLESAGLTKKGDKWYLSDYSSGSGKLD
jgi:peptide/nickel transport system substrate-binding protein